MKIVQAKHETHAIPLHEVGRGAVVRLYDGTPVLYITAGTFSSDCRTLVRLHDGITVGAAFDELVQPVDATLYVGKVPETPLPRAKLKDSALLDIARASSATILQSPHTGRTMVTMEETYLLRMMRGLHEGTL
jgi:hypothetical protein